MATITIGQLIQSSISGYSGYSGSGISGFSGLGLSGYSGISGFSGQAGQSGISGFSGSGGSSLANDTTTNSDSYYPVMAFNSTSGTLSTAYVSSTKMYYNPSTGTLSATNVNSLSDKELKENVASIQNATNVIIQLDGVSFTWKDTGKKSFGVIAQDLEKVIPELVDGIERKTVNYSGLIGFLLNAVKELDDRIKKIENK